MDFVSVRVITDDVRRLVAFYEQATGLPARWATDDFAELVTPSCTLPLPVRAPCSCLGQAPRARRTTIPPSSSSASTTSTRNYERLKTVVSAFVQEPTTMPWGNRSLLFRDTDGNLVNFFTPVSADAVKRFER